MNHTHTGKRIAVFLLITFALTYAFEIFVVAGAVNAKSPLSTLLVSAVMFFPAIGVVLTRVITKEGFRDAWILPNFKGHVRFYIAAWLVPIGLTVAGGVLYFLVYPDRFDPGMGYVTQQYTALGIDFDADTQRGLIWVQMATSVLLAPLLNIVTATGEEWGWRGYLVPKLREKLPIVPTVLLSGVIWGLWHAPLTVMGHNYGMNYPGYPYMGILAMCAFCVVMGTLFSYVSLRTRSCLPAAVAHGTLNGFAAIGFYFTPGPEAIDAFTGPAPTGLLGGAGFIAAMVVLLVWIVKLKRKGTLIAPPKAPKSVESNDVPMQA